ncbi:ROK family transcriptional regulator [Wenjunlia tyrosinilytica]|uniref:Sugar kinase n=1 Tax=Wenjunlia tyrosinilytica TaxID=1544741 RepID=A0A917ZJ20_9ACTN|nr:ROK family transcriptional regulator [Wenjunlia tyrosinilytica]GGO84284.1 sugar kinase [Wenjunlia tyrosinilytica]
MLQLRDHLGPATGTREFNRKRILLAIMIKADTQAGLARRTLLSQGTVSNTVRELELEGLVQGEKGAPSRGSGRGTRVRLLPAKGVAVGVHLGFNHATVVARRVDRDHGDISVQREEGGANRGLPEVMPVVRQMIEAAVADTGLGRDDVVSLGLAVPRMVDPRSGTFTSPVLPPWTEGDAPAQELGRWLGVRAVQDNDANLGALAEQTYATDSDFETVVYIKASTGIGAGLIIGNNLIRGHRGIAGEIGHLTLEPDGTVCRCGGRGCLETVIGADFLVRQVRQALTGNAVDVPNSLASLIDRAHAGDAVCLRVVQDAGRTLGLALSQLCNLLNPDLIVLGGQLAAARDLVLRPCRESLERCALRGAVDPSSGFELKLSSLRQLTEAQGALVLGLRAHERNDEAQGAAA